MSLVRCALSLFILVGVFAPGGCATVVSGTQQKVTITSDPPGATVDVNGGTLMV